MENLPVFSMLHNNRYSNIFKSIYFSINKH